MSIGLVGDGIEHPPNARALLDAAAMFRVPCVFHDTRGLTDAWSIDRGGELELVETSRLLTELAPLVAIENAPRAQSVYEARLPTGSSSIVVGNERRGIRGDVLRAAQLCLEIPMPGRGVNTLNVAAAAAVALYYLLGRQRHTMRQATNPERRRPALLLASPTDHVEAGSTLRSAAAFGWRTVGMDDTHHVWFGVERSAFAEGRAAARQHRNQLRILRMAARPPLGFSRVIVAGSRVDGPPLNQVDLAAGAGTLLVLPDEEATLDTDWLQLAQKVEFARVGVPAQSFSYRYRLLTGIVLAETARQIGMAADVRARPARGRLSYESALELLALEPADVISGEELMAF